MLLKTFLELCVVVGRSAGRSPTGRLSTAALCRGLEKNGMVGARHGLGMASVNQTRPRCVNQMGKTHSKPLAARNDRGTAWARHAMCVSAVTLYTCELTQSSTVMCNLILIQSAIS